ncbi:hypothetical protein PF008_g591 [Phytophthora fragariae]|uniref:Uncharacterized protein n=1 Tax=Phytophthora fragariae TaxID=53985 RepID=A0A6G0SPM4_9STRA|nr:hypothetical protein PF008_g591 [Phytophthora fragariae]
MTTRGTTDQASPSSPSSRAESAHTDRERPPAAAAVAPPDVVGVAGASEPCTTAPAMRTSATAPLRTSKRATPKAVPGESAADASKVEKHVAKRATVASSSGVPRKTAGDGDDDSGSDLEDKAPAPPAKRPRKVASSAKAKPAKAVEATKRPSPQPRSDGGFDLHEFMASFSPGTAREESAAPDERTAPEESPTAIPLPSLGKTSSPRGTHALKLLYGSLAGGKLRSSSGFRHLTWPVLTTNAQMPAPNRR